MDGDDFVAQALAFLIASFETTGTTLTYALYELALHPDVQSRLREEITQVLDNHHGQLTYEGIREMSYLDMVVRGKVTGTSYVWDLRFSRQRE
jgi:cytochrome P450 family 6